MVCEIRFGRGCQIFLTPQPGHRFLPTPPHKNLLSPCLLTSSPSSPLYGSPSSPLYGAMDFGQDGTAASAAADAGGRGESAAAAAGPSSERQVIRWEKFLPRRSLRVLLVEHDDSTRHIVAALLRKCSYHVAAVANGFKAWVLLMDQRYNFDLVLTEVDMPSLSGIGLLSKIMAAEKYKNIPVIMMSTQDSIGVVLKCMLKGAVDFLVKPVRKNELRNLWQHVWRRHCLINDTNASDNNAASNRVSSNAVVGSKTGENSDDDDAQSTGSKPDNQRKSVKEHIETLPAVENFSREFDPKDNHPNVGITIVANQLKKHNDEESRDKTSELTIQVNQPAQAALFSAQQEDMQYSYKGSIFREEEGIIVRGQVGEDVGAKIHCQSDAANKSSRNMIEFIDSIANRHESAALERIACREDVPCEPSTSCHEKITTEFSSSKLFELSLRRPQLNGCINLELKKNHVLNHSNASAFSRYGDMKSHAYRKQASSSLCLGTKDTIDKTQLQVSLHNYSNEKNSLSPREMLSDQGKTSVYFQVSSDTNKDGGRSSHPIQDGACAFYSSDGAESAYQPSQFGFLPLPVPVEAIPYQRLSPGYGTVVRPLFYSETYFRTKDSTEPGEKLVPVVSDKCSHHDIYPTSHSQRLDYRSHEEEHLCSFPRRHQAETETPKSGEPSYTHLEQINYSASSSLDIYRDWGISGGCKTTDTTSNTPIAVEIEHGSGIHNSGQKGLDSDRSRREAALIKFRLKRKDRCFEKKVRYQSRKKLAEQRPRVKGQFVRQKTIDPSAATEVED